MPPFSLSYSLFILLSLSFTPLFLPPSLSFSLFLIPSLFTPPSLSISLSYSLSSSFWCRNLRISEAIKNELACNHFSICNTISLSTPILFVSTLSENLTFSFSSIKIKQMTTIFYHLERNNSELAFDFWYSYIFKTKFLTRYHLWYLFQCFRSPYLLSQSALYYILSKNRVRLFRHIYLFTPSSMISTRLLETNIKVIKTNRRRWT